MVWRVNCLQICMQIIYDVTDFVFYWINNLFRTNQTVLIFYIIKSKSLHRNHVFFLIVELIFKKTTKIPLLSIRINIIFPNNGINSMLKVNIWSWKCFISTFLTWNNMEIFYPVLEIWGEWSTPSLPLLPGPLLSQVVVSTRVLSMD